MSAYSLPSSYAEGIATLGRRDSRKVANNTTLRRAGDAVILRHWRTDILEHYADGWTVVTLSGWHTVTTLARVNGALPGPFRIGSAGKRGTYVYAHGYAVCPFVDGIAVNPSTGEVGMLTGSGVATLYSADDIAEVMAAEDTRRAERDRKRAARILREHPTARPVTYREDVVHSAYGHTSPLPNPHRAGQWRSMGECERCRAEQAEWDSIRGPILAADHAATDGRHDVSGTIANGGTWRQAPTWVWDCPECKAAGLYAYGTRY